MLRAFVFVVVFLLGTATGVYLIAPLKISTPATSSPGVSTTAVEPALNSNAKQADDSDAVAPQAKKQNLTSEPDESHSSVAADIESIFEAEDVHVTLSEIPADLLPPIEDIERHQAEEAARKNKAAELESQN